VFWHEAELAHLDKLLVPHRRNPARRSITRRPEMRARGRIPGHAGRQLLIILLIGHAHRVQQASSGVGRSGTFHHGAR
jgi:hypothetical protein